MSKKYKFIFCAIGLAFLAIILGVCFVFFGNKVVKPIPTYVKIESFDGQYYAIAEQKADFGYKFKIEQYIEDNYILVDFVENNSNAINLSEQKINLNSGNKFRISVCYTADGRNDGAFSNGVEWTAKSKLGQVDYDSLNVIGASLVWNEIPHADGYKILIYDADFELTTLTSNTNQVEVPFIGEKCIVFVVATSTNENIVESSMGTGKELYL